MTTVVIVAVLVGLAGVVFGARCYLELWRWGKLMQGAHITVAYKEKVKLTAPLQEWALWCRNVEDTQEYGRVVYRIGGTSIAVIRKREGQRPRLPARKRGKMQAPRSRTKQGKWAARDETRRNVTA